MKITLYALAALACLPLAAQPLKYGNIQKIDSLDTHQRIIAKAAHTLPTPNQLRALQDGFIAFVHFGPNTFTGKEWGNGMEDPSVFDLNALDTDQWCKAIRDAGMKSVILTAKHHDGFVLWQSRYTSHGIMSCGYKNGKGDIMAELSESCRKYGLRLGVYLSPADLYQIESPEGLYGNSSKYSERIIPRPVEGRPFKDTSTFRVMADDYNEYFMNQLFELLTEYGPIHEVWFDGAHPKQKGGQKYNYQAWESIIRRLAPQAVIFGRADLRWCGNESGATRNEEWNVVGYNMLPLPWTPFPDLTTEDLGSRERLYEAKFLMYQPSETNTSIREGWFYRDEPQQRIRSADDVFDIYERSVGGNSIFLLNVPAGKDGRLPAKDVQVLEEVGRRIRDTYGENLMVAATAPAEITDGDDTTYITVQEGDCIEITLPEKTTFNRLLIGEAVAATSERVESHSIEICSDGIWTTIAEGTNIGYRHIHRFADVTADSIRITFGALRAPAGIREVSIHRYKSPPPELEISSDTEGKISLKARNTAFLWKSHGENPAENLHSGYRIHYTIDGTSPDAYSPLYDKAFKAENVILKAVAIHNGRYGAVLSERVGYAKSGWKISASRPYPAGHTPELLGDCNPHTYCLIDAEHGGAEITIDLGEAKAIGRMQYIPPAKRGAGLIESGTISCSTDGKTWKECAEFSFGNILNNPVAQTCIFKPLTARYVRISIAGTVSDAGRTGIAEINLYDR